MALLIYSSSHRERWLSLWDSVPVSDTGRDLYSGEGPRCHHPLFPSWGEHPTRPISQLEISLEISIQHGPHPQTSYWVQVSTVDTVKGSAARGRNHLCWGLAKRFSRTTLTRSTCHLTRYHPADSPLALIPTLPSYICHTCGQHGDDDDDGGVHV